MMNSNNQYERKIWGHELLLNQLSPIEVIKEIHATEPLSVQLHTDKSEIFVALKPSVVYIMSFDRLSSLYQLYKDDFELFKLHVSTKTVFQYLDKIELQPFETLMVPPYTVHSIGAGHILEYSKGMQTTIRLYDWGRVDDNGDRPLNTELVFNLLSMKLYNKEGLTRL